MIDTDAATLAFRVRMLALAACTTGSVSLSATTTGYARTTGSFLADGLRDGMEFLAAGFATSSNNGVRIIESVSALSLTTTTISGIASPTVEAEAAGRTLSVGIPVGRALDNKSFSPISGRPYIEEEFVDGGHSLETCLAQGGVSNEDGFYIVKWYGLSGYGEAGIRRPTDALKARFATGTILSAAGVPIHVGANPAPTAGQIIPQGNGWSVRVVSIPWWALSQNLVTA